MIIYMSNTKQRNREPEKGLIQALVNGIKNFNYAKFFQDLVWLFILFAALAFWAKFLG